MISSLLRFALRLTLATLAIGTVGGAFVSGYFIGFRQALHEAYFEPAVVVIREAPPLALAGDHSSHARATRETKP